MTRIVTVRFGKTIASPIRATPMPRYIGFRTQRYGPETTRRRGGSNGAGVPRPRHANSQTHGSAIAAPIAMTIQPSGRGLANARLPTIHVGTKYVHSEMNAGATISARKMAKSRRVSMRTSFGFHLPARGRDGFAFGVRRLAAALKALPSQRTPKAHVIVERVCRPSPKHRSHTPTR